jgi:hypothetical protein
MILVDSSVWIDYFHGTVSRESGFLAGSFGESHAARETVVFPPGLANSARIAY